MHQPIPRTRRHYVMKTVKRSKRVPAQARVTAQCRRSGCTNVRRSKRACCTRSPCSCSYCISRSCLHELQLQRDGWRKVCPTIAELAVSKKAVQKLSHAAPPHAIAIVKTIASCLSVCKQGHTPAAWDRPYNTPPESRLTASFKLRPMIPLPLVLRSN